MAKVPHNAIANLCRSVVTSSKDIFTNFLRFAHISQI